MSYHNILQGKFNLINKLVNMNKAVETHDHIEHLLRICIWRITLLYGTKPILYVNVKHLTPETTVCLIGFLLFLHIVQLGTKLNNILRFNTTNTTTNYQDLKIITKREFGIEKFLLDRNLVLEYHYWTSYWSWTLSTWSSWILLLEWKRNISPRQDITQ